MQSNPIVVGGVLYATTPTLKVVARRRGDGPRAVEVRSEQRRRAGRPLPPPRRRGPRRSRVRHVSQLALRAAARRAGSRSRSFGTNGRVDLREGLGRPADKLTVTASTPGVVFEDLLIMGSTVPETLPSAPGDIRAFDVNTGKIRWSFHTIPHPGEPGYETWPTDAWKIAGGANAWSGVSRRSDARRWSSPRPDRRRSTSTAPTARETTFTPTACSRSTRGPGKHVWHFQGLQHDVWDLDFPAAPNLVTVTRDGRKVDAVAQVTKTGFVFVLDRSTGKPLFPDRVSRRCPSSTIDGEQLSRTQPVPVLPPPFARSGPTEAMLTRRTPAGARGRARAVPQAEVRLLRAAVARGHDHLSRRRRRRGMGRRGLRSRERRSSSSTRTRCRGSCG